MEKKNKVAEDVKKFTVNRKRWFRGKGDTKSALLTPSDKMCCLGFYARSCGLPKSQILNILSPMEVHFQTETDDYGVAVGKNKNWHTKLVKNGVNTKTCQQLMVVNDNEELEDKKRESKIKALFKTIGITVKFEG